MAIDLDKAFGIDCGHKVQRDFSLDEIDEQGAWVPLMI